MIDYVVVLPYVYQPYFDACIATCRFPEENMLLVDNTVSNVGIMRAHNMGVDRLRERDADWLIIMSAAIRFGAPGGLDFVDLIDQLDPTHYIIHAGTPKSPPTPNQAEATPPEGEYVNGVFGWHLTAFKREVFDNIGKWDENFTPYGYDDIDLSVRVQKHYKGCYNGEKGGWGTYPIDVADTTMGHSINLAGVRSPAAPKIDYFTEKWGRHPADWQTEPWDHPFNNPENTLAYWPQAPNGARWND